MTHNDENYYDIIYSSIRISAVVVGTRATRSAGTTKIIHGTKNIKQVCRDPIRGWIVEYVDGDKKDVTHNEVVDLFSSYEAPLLVARLVADEEQRKLFEAAAAAEADWVEAEAAKLASQQLAKEQEEVARLAAVEAESARQLAEKEQERARQEQEAARLLAAMEEEAQKQRVAKAEAAQQLVTKQEEAVKEEEHTGRTIYADILVKKSNNETYIKQRISKKRERERTQHSFHDNDQVQKQPLRQLQEKKKKQMKTITNRKKSEKDNNDEIMMKVSSPLASMAPSESDKSESVSVSSEKQVPATTVVVLPASTLLVHTENATTTHTVAASASASLLSPPPLAVLTTDSPRRMMNGSGTPDTTRTAVLQVAPVASVSDPFVQPRLSASASATINASFRFQGNDKNRFNHLFNAELKDIHKRNNGMNSETFTGIAEKMNCDIQKVMYHFYNSGREHEITKGYL